MLADGNIAAEVGLKDVTTGDTLCAENDKIVLERMEFPEPVISVEVEPRSKVDQDKMGVALGKLAQEDPSFRVLMKKQGKQLFQEWVNSISILLWIVCVGI